MKKNLTSLDTSDFTKRGRGVRRRKEELLAGPIVRRNSRVLLFRQLPEGWLLGLEVTVQKTAMTGKLRPRELIPWPGCSSATSGKVLFIITYQFSTTVKILLIV